MALNQLRVCQTCVRDKPLPADEASRGALLTQALIAELERHDFGPDFALRRVNCLSGCLNPCNIALRGQGKYSLRFSRLQAADALAIIELTKQYIADPIGDIKPQQCPPELQDKITSRMPPPQLFLHQQQ